jgi:chemotaxis family two-component system sensor kinase Cph1
MTEKNKSDRLPAVPPRISAEHNQIISDYTYAVTHDLNAHLRHIMQYGELLKMEEKDRLSADGIMYVDKLIVSTKRLRQLINDLLSYAHVLHIKEEKEELDLNKTVTEVVEEITAAKENNATINTGLLPVMAVYPTSIKQLFHHLITNALVYRGAEDLVITIGCVDKGTHYLFSVQDNGIGIAEEYREIIFNPLKRLHSHDKIEGSGLGLAICEKAVEAHCGRIWVESNPTGEGSMFFFTITK